MAPLTGGDEAAQEASLAGQAAGREAARREGEALRGEGEERKELEDAQGGGGGINKDSQAGDGNAKSTGAGERPAGEAAGTAATGREGARGEQGEQGERGDRGGQGERGEQKKQGGSGNRLVTDEEYEEARRRFRANMGMLNANPYLNPENAILVAQMMVYHIERGARKLAEVAKVLVDDFGDVVRPYLRSSYEWARAQMEEAGASVDGMTPYEEARGFDAANFDKVTADVLDTVNVQGQEKEVEESVKEAQKKGGRVGRGGKKEVSSQREPDLFSMMGDGETLEQPAGEAAGTVATGERNVGGERPVGEAAGTVAMGDEVGTRGEGGQPAGEAAGTSATGEVEARMRFARAVAGDMLAALTSGERPYKSIRDLRARAREMGMEVDEEGRTDVLLQELVERGLVAAAREVVESGRYGERGSKTAFDAVKKLYELQPTIGQRSSERIRLQQYSTPLPMSFVADMWVYREGMTSVLEPTAGNGMLAFAIPAGVVHANELDATRRGNLEGQGFASVTGQDATKPFEGGRQYDGVVANPPFGGSEGREYDGTVISGLDPQIALNALDSMKDDGRAAIIIGGNMEYAANGAVSNKRDFFCYLYDHYNVVGVVDMAGELYAKQGTKYPTRMILINGRRSEEERAQTTVYPPVREKALKKVETFDELYNTIKQLTFNNEKTNGTEILRTQSLPLPERGVGGRTGASVLGSSDENGTDGRGGRRGEGGLGSSGRDRSGAVGGTGREGNERSGESGVSGLPGAGGATLEVRDGADNGGAVGRGGRGAVDGRGGGVADVGASGREGRTDGVLGGRTSERGVGLSGEADLGGETAEHTATGTRGEGGQPAGKAAGTAATGEKGTASEESGSASGRNGAASGENGAALGRKEEKRELGDEKMAYKPHNGAFSLESVAPAAMVEAMDATLKKIEGEVGDIETWVQGELGYGSVEELHRALVAEQIDSVAMAIYQMKQGQALIIGDQTGVGKGRQMAALIRWAVRQGKKPVFVTQKADLFTDIYRDLVGVGSGELRPFIFNADGAMEDAEGETVHRPLNDKVQKRVMEGVVYGGTQVDKLEGFDFFVLTYSQVNKGDAQSKKEAAEAAKKSGKRGGKKKVEGAEESPLKAAFLRIVAKDNYMLLDESHTAAGESNQGAYFQSLIREAKGATFASATFAKRPDTMPLYALRTAMSKAKMAAHELIEAIQKGGVTLQEIMSRALTEAGQMVRRERDMTGVRTDWKTVDDAVTVERARRNYDRTVEAFNDIVAFQEAYVKPYIEQLNKQMAAVAASAGVKKGTDKMGLGNVPFASKAYNYTKQLMLALKADAIVEEVAKEIAAGRHPVIALESTMESAYKDDYGPGSTIEHPTFGLSLARGLDSVLAYTVREGKKTVSVPFAPSVLGEDGERAYYELRRKIEAMTSDIFISPLDAIIDGLRARGFRVGELTGRETYLERTGDGRAIVRHRADKNKKKKIQREFNSGELDVLILNKSASTGISLHASEAFSDRRQRSMIIAQPLSDINDYMQMIGRIDRTGQVSRGYYINLGLPVPAEQRFLMMLSTKLKSLNANTTTSQESKGNDVEAPDLLNKYGSQVIVEYLRENPEIYEQMGEPLKDGKGTVPADGLDAYKPTEDDARKVTGYVALLPTSVQEEFL